MTASLNITVNGQSGDLSNTVPFDLSDDRIREIAAEAVASGSVRGISAVQADFSFFVVDRYPEVDGLPNRIMLRPKAAFGSW